MLVDSHCHLNYEDFRSDFTQMLQRAALCNVKIMQTISTKFADFLDIKDIIETYPNIYGSIGVHPHEVEEHPKVTLEDLLNYTNHNKIIGVGETGLDLYYNHSQLNKQKEAFLTHIEASHLSGLPLIIHTRSADQLTIEILAEARKNYGNYTGVIHCFSSDSLDFAKECLKLGLYISISGIVTFKKAIALQEIVRELPLDRLLIETDSPYLAPEPNRGKRNEPSFVVKVAEKIAELKNIDFNEVALITTDNFFKLFTKALR